MADFKYSYKLLLFIVSLLIVTIACTSNQDRVTEEDYKRAEKFLTGNTNDLVHNTIFGEQWMSDNKLLYRYSVKEGARFMLADPITGESNPAFDHDKLAETLSELREEDYEAADLPFRSIDLSDNYTTLSFSVQNSRYECTLDDYTCTTSESPNNGNRFNESVSPDGKKSVYIKDDNLWMRNNETGQVTPLTYDGVKDFGYATNNAGWTKRNSPVLLWSSDSKRIATFQHDGRGVRDMVLASTKVGHPELEQWKYPLPGDSLIFRIERVVINLEQNPRLVRLKMAPDAQRSTLTDHIAGRNGTLLDAEWSADSRKLSFVSTSRDHKVVHLRTANPVTGNVQTHLREEADTFFESGDGEENWHVMPESNEFIWFSQRDNWGHLYLYDLQNGEMKHQITSGEWNVLQVRHIDYENRMIYFIGNGRDGNDPYYEYLYRIGMDGENMELLTPDIAHHSINISPDGDYFTDSYSTPTTPPVTVLRDIDGNVVSELAKADISELEAMGWQSPIPFNVKARDGETDLYGLMYTPTKLNTSKSYPVLNYLYPGPQSGSVGSRAFRASRSDKQALAELGFVVIEVDAMGTPGRSKEFHEFYYGNMGDNGIPDQIAAIRQLGEQHSYIDTSRVGIFGHSGGGFASTRAILAYPDFYDVAVSGAGNHDNRNYADPWGEKWQGLLEETENGTNYDNQANQLLAENLKGKLLLTHGTLDSNVPPYNTLLVVNALIEANKDFDLIMFPNRGHGFYSEPYMMRKRWDYFVKHLKGVDPPEQYTFGE